MECERRAMLLVIDVGNTNVKVGAFEADRLVASWRIRTDRERTADEYGAEMIELLRQRHIEPRALNAVALSGVVYAVNDLLAEASRTSLEMEPFVFGASTDLGIPIRYDSREELGADRICNAVAARAHYGCPLVVVDCGTATKVEAIDASGSYIGGAIAPGIGISTDALFAAAPRLRPVEMTAPDDPIGRNTVDSLRSGIVHGFAGLVDGLVARFRARIGESAHVVATGGLARVVQPVSKTIQITDPDLTLEGVRLIWERNRVAC